MNKRFIAEVLKLMPNFSVSGSYFYQHPVDHILCGFLCEDPPSGPYIWSYSFPLYDRFKRLHLGFGSRLPGADAHMETKHGTPKEQAEEFVMRIQPHLSEVAALADLNQFVEYIESRFVVTGLIQRVHQVRRGYANTLILLDREDEAARELEAICDMDRVKNDPTAMKDLAKLRQDLSAGLDTAKKTLGEWELDTKKKLGIKILHS